MQRSSRGIKWLKNFLKWIHKLFDWLKIVHVWYIKILTWLQGFLVIFPYLVCLSLCSSLFWELRDNGVVKKFAILTLKHRTHVRVLIYWTWAITASRCSVPTEPPKPYKHLDAQPFKVPCEQSENVEQSRVDKVFGQIFRSVENSSSVVWTWPYRRWSLRRKKPQGVSSEKMSEHIYFMEDNLLRMCRRICAVSCGHIVLKFFLYSK